MFKDATNQEIDNVLNNAVEAGKIFRKKPLTFRHRLMESIADGLEADIEELADTAHRETSLAIPRLEGEVKRTALQLRQYGKASAEGAWMNIRIDKAGYENVKVDLRKMQIPIGPVVVFGSSNFPFAYSTAGGDTACALAAGCPVIVKAHPAHAATSQKVADIISHSVAAAGLPEGVFSHVYGVAFEVGEYLVKHPLVRAVGFTGSLAGGRALYDWASRREVPIPVFSEMGSTNPVFILPEKLKTDYENLASEYARSITNDAGQFCTKPGLIAGIKGQDFDRFKNAIKEKFLNIAPQKMLHAGIAKSYDHLAGQALDQEGVSQIAATAIASEIKEGKPILTTVSGKDFIGNAVLHQEVFGPFSIIIECNDMEEMMEVAKSIDGKLTTTIIGNEDELKEVPDLIDTLREICGRIIFNGVPTGVTVAWAMNHGGPYPATTDSRFTSVGSDGIIRFTRPVCYQNCPDELLPDELKDSNPLGLWRMENGEWKMENGKKQLNN